MKTLALILFSFCIFISALCVPSSALASDRITASITVTNLTVNGNTFTVNGNVRTWTNNVVTASTQIATNADVTGCGSKTNLLSQIGLNLYSNIKLIDTGSNSLQLQGDCGGALIVSIGGTWASVSYSTQACAVSTPIGVPFANYYSSLTVRSNTGTQLASDLDAYDTNNTFLDLTKTQTATGAKTFSSASGIWKGIVSQLNDLANVFRGGYASNLFIDKSTFSNAVNYGNAFSSRGAGISSEQYGQSANANGTEDIAIGKNASSSGLQSIALGSGSSAPIDGAIAIGALSTANQLYSTALGYSSSAQSGGATAVGYTASATGSNSTAIGFAASASFDNSTAIGANATTTTSNQVMIASQGVSVVVQNNLTVQTNLTVGKNAVISGNFSPQGLTTNLTTTGTNNFPQNSDIAFSRFPITTLANGNNAAVPVGTNVFVEVSGPSADFTINGLANGRDGKMIVIVNQTGFNMTIAHQSGTDPTAANRIISMTGADRVTTGNGAATLIYSGAASRWLLIQFDP